MDPTMKPVAILIGAFATLASTSAFAQCQFGQTPQGRCVDQWGNIIPTEDERRYDSSGVIRVNLANESAYYTDGQWRVRTANDGQSRDQGRLDRQPQTANVSYRYRKTPDVTLACR